MSGPERYRTRIDRALAVLDETDEATLRGYLADTGLNEKYQDPERLRDLLENAPADRMYPPYQAALQLLRAAGETAR
jgi:hypothetical protein